MDDGTMPPIKPDHVVMGPTPLGQRPSGSPFVTARRWLVLVLATVFVIVVALGGAFF